MKTFCILEQGNSVNDPLTIQKKRIFTTEFSDFFRLNWQRDDDPNADLVKKGITWSEGRSYLYENVPKNYLYYIFIDDDISFQNKDNDNCADKINELLLEYKPITGTFFDPNQWMFKNHTQESIAELSSLKVFPISGYDLQLQFFSKSYADLMFPVFYHGSGKSMWYSQRICFKLFPMKQICFTEIVVSNTRHADHSDHLNSQNSSGEKLLWLFNRNLINKSDALYFRKQILDSNLIIQFSIPSKEKILVSETDLSKVYDVTNIDFLNRKSFADKEYEKRIDQYKIKWITSRFFWWYKLNNLINKVRGKLNL